MLNVILIIFGVIAVVYFFNSYQNKYQSFQGVVFNFVVVVFFIFLLISVSHVYFSSDVEFNSFSSILSFVKVYFSWLGGFFQNLGNIGGYVVSLDWTGNMTN